MQKKKLKSLKNKTIKKKPKIHIEVTKDEMIPTHCPVKVTFAVGPPGDKREHLRVLPSLKAAYYSKVFKTIGKEDTPQAEKRKRGMSKKSTL